MSFLTIVGYIDLVLSIFMRDPILAVIGAFLILSEKIDRLDRPKND